MALYTFSCLQYIKTVGEETWLLKNIHSLSTIKLPYPSTIFYDILIGYIYIDQARLLDHKGLMLAFYFLRDFTILYICTTN